MLLRELCALLLKRLCVAERRQREEGRASRRDQRTVADVVCLYCTMTSSSCDWGRAGGGVQSLRIMEKPALRIDRAESATEGRTDI